MFTCVYKDLCSSANVHSTQYVLHTMYYVVSIIVDKGRIQHSLFTVIVLLTLFHLRQLPFPLTVNTRHTSQNSFNKWTKIASVEIIIFDRKKWSRIYFEIHQAPSEIPANLPGKFSHSGQKFLHWAAATLKGLGEFQNKKSRPLFTIIFK